MINLNMLPLAKLQFPKKIVLVILAVVTLVFLALVVPQKNKNENKAGQVAFPAFESNLQPDQDFADLSDLQLESAAELIIQLPMISLKETIDFFSNLATDYNLVLNDQIESAAANKKIYWTSNLGYLEVYQPTGQFEFKLFLNQKKQSVPAIAEVDAANLAREWLKKYQFIPENTSFQTLFFKKEGYELKQVENKNEVEIFRFIFFPTIHQLPLFFPETDETPLIVEVTASGEIFRVFHQAFPYLMKDGYRQTTKAKLKSSLKIQQEISQKLPTITRLNSEINQPLKSHQIKKVFYKKIDLGYRLSTDETQLIPVFQLTGTAKTDIDESVTVTAYLPALAE
jgi:hypothetical protein